MLGTGRDETGRGETRLNLDRLDGRFPVLAASWGTMALAGGRRGRRAALRGLLAVGATKAISRVARPSTAQASSATAAMAGAFVTATAIESLPWAGPAAAIGLVGMSLELADGAGGDGAEATIGGSTVPTGVAVVSGAALGAAAAAATLRWWPRIDTSPAAAPTAPRSHRGLVGSDGDGLVVVANPGAGPGDGDGPLNEIRRGLPSARIIELGTDDDLVDVLEEAGTTASSLGVLGGDGSINAAATVAMNLEVPLAIFPGGTLNHFARDLGLERMVDAIDAVTEGTVIEVDTGTIADRLFLNTASVGSYPELVVAREQLEDRIGKWPAMLVAMTKVLRAATPTRITLDGEERDVWMIFIGNCAYLPAGFAPASRPRLDDNRLDVRLVEGSHPGSRARLIMSLLTGTLGRSRVYERRLAERLEISVQGEGPVRLATDGEAFDGPSTFVVTKHPRSLHVHAPAR